MTTYLIVNRIIGHSFVYEADSKTEALDKFAQDAGFHDYADACETIGGRGDLIVEEVSRADPEAA